MIGHDQQMNPIDFEVKGSKVRSHLFEVKSGFHCIPKGRFGLGTSNMV
jgi:hypothetical protein